MPPQTELKDLPAEQGAVAGPGGEVPQELKAGKKSVSHNFSQYVRRFYVSFIFHNFSIIKISPTKFRGTSGTNGTSSSSKFNLSSVQFKAQSNPILGGGP